MFENYVADTAETILPVLCKDLLSAPVRSSRNWKMRELMNVRIRLVNPLDREILLSSRRASYPAQIAETMWILAGRNDVEWLSNYLPRAADFSDDGVTWRGGYGPRIRNWGGVDQLAHVVNLLRRDPDTRRAVIAIYDPAIDSTLEGAKDVPCNDFLQFLLRDGRLHLTVFTRSNDVIWGWSGINQFEWSYLLELVAGLLDVSPGDLIFNITSLHLYAHHYDRARKIAEDSRPTESLTSPGSGRYPDLEAFDRDLGAWFTAEELIRRGEPRALEAASEIRNPRLRLWLKVLADWWGVSKLGEAFLDTRYKRALGLSPGRPKLPVVSEVTRSSTEFTQYVSDLHEEKHNVYGDSWKRRGEFLGILANVARKVDRLGEAGAGDTSADTAVDLLVYLVKYGRWLRGEPDGPAEVEADLEAISASDRPKDRSSAYLIARIKETFDEIEGLASAGDPTRYSRVWETAVDSFVLAERLRWKESNESRSWKGYEVDED